MNSQELLKYDPTSYLIINQLEYLVLFLIVHVLTLLFFSKIETKVKGAITFYDDQKILILHGVLSGLILPFISNYIPFTSIINLVLAYMVSREAKKLGRNQPLWLILSIFGVSSSLIILGLSPRLKPKHVSKHLNSEYLSLKSTLKSLFDNQLIDKLDYERKIEILKFEFTERLANQEGIEKEEINKPPINKSDLLKKALDSGLISTKEYDSMSMK